eukprot:2368855-Pleurochrysis_carterae.AAC.3
MVTALLSQSRARTNSTPSAGHINAQPAAGDPPRIREAALQLAMRSSEFLDLELLLRDIHSKNGRLIVD